MVIALVMICLLGLFAGVHGPVAGLPVTPPVAASSPPRPVVVRVPDKATVPDCCERRTPHYRDLTLPDTHDESSGDRELCR